MFSQPCAQEPHELLHHCTLSYLADMARYCMSLVTPAWEQAIYKCHEPCSVLSIMPASATKLLLVCLVLKNVALFSARATSTSHLFANSF